MTLRASGLTGQPPDPNPDATYLNDVFVDGSGNYVGVAGPWLHASSLPLYSFYDCASNPVGGLVALLATYWNDPQCGTRANIYDYPTYNYGLVTDNSGPKGFESEQAGVITGAGFPGNLSWGGGNWQPNNGSTWIYQGWFRSLDCSGFTCGLGFALAGYPAIALKSFTITDSWQFVQTTFTWPYASGATGIPVISLSDSKFTNSEERTGVSVPPFIFTFDLTKYEFKYNIEMKQVHLYQGLVSKGRHISTRV